MESQSCCSKDTKPKLTGENTVRCMSCNKAFSSAQNLSRHNNSIHSMKFSEGNYGVSDYYECFFCGLTSKRKDSIKRHIFRQHMMEKRLNFECDHCGRGFTEKENLRRHIRDLHLLYLRLDRTSLNIKCVLCDSSYHRKSMARLHLERQHGIVIRTEQFHFPNEGKFASWKKELEISTDAQYIVVSSVRNKTNLFVKYACHRSGSYRKKMNRVRRLRLLGSKKINGFCPAEIVLRKCIVDGCCNVSHTSTHVGHKIFDESELGYTHFCKDDRKTMASKIESGIPLNRILDDLSAQAISQSKTEKVHILQTQDLYNVAVSFKLKATPYCTQPEMITLDTFTEEQRNSILYYKKQNELDQLYSFLREEDVVLIIMSKLQKEMLRQHGRDTIALENIHGNDFFMQILLMIDDYEEGLAVAFSISNVYEERLINIFLSCIKENVGVLNPKILFTSAEERNYNCWVETMGCPAQHLYATWYVREDWNKNLMKILNKEKRKRMRLQLDALASETNEHGFLEKLYEFISQYDPDIENFMKFFQLNYATSTVHWASCYRLSVDTNADRHCESFSNTLRYWFGNRKKKDLFGALGMLSRYLRKKEKELKIRAIKGKRSRKLKLLRRRHDALEKSENLSCASVEEKEANRRWLVSSFRVKDTGTEMYTVKRSGDKCQNCKLYCDKCDACLHEYVCSCVDSSVKHNMCEHIHFLCFTFQKRSRFVVEPVNERSSVPV